MRVSNFFAVITICLTCFAAVGVDAAEQVRVIAETGFNDAIGINANGLADSPYQLHSPLNGQGGVEPLWGPAWVANPEMARVTTNHPWEGDGQLTMYPTTGMHRTWNEPEAGLFIIDQRIRLTANSRLVTGAGAVTLTGPLRDSFMIA